MDQPAEDGFAADPVGSRGEGDYVRGVVRGAQAHSLALMAATGVVVRDVLLQDDAKVAFAGDEDAVGALTAHTAHEPLGDGVHPRRLRRGRDRGDAGRPEHRVERGSELSVRSVGDGTVVRKGWDGAYGVDVLVKLNDGKYALYAHLSQTSVFVGEQVTAGRQIGQSGATGHVTGPHLHFEVRTTPYYGSDVNPVAYLQAHGVTI